MSLDFESLRNRCEPFRDGARHPGRMDGRIERGRVRPNPTQSIVNDRLAEILQKYAKRLPIGELAVDFAVSPKIGVDLEAMPHIADDDERRWFVACWQQPHVILG